jgi:hypothetical protein
VQVDWDGRVVWKFSHTERVKDEGKAERWMARQHHDFEREGSPTGYPAPGQEPKAFNAKTLILTHENVKNTAISDHVLIDDKIIEVNWDGEILWQWKASEHFDEFGFDADAKKALRVNPSLHGEAGGDWMHINNLALVGQNRFFDAGDERFNPQNIIIDGRNSNIMAIISRETGKIVWRLGPRFDGNDAERALGWIIGQHHLHIIPQNLPGAGNMLVFDNGGQAGYGAPNPLSPDGQNNVWRDYSRVLEFNPQTLEIVWQYTPLEAGALTFTDGSKFYSSYISSAQRLENGNTLITEGADGRLIEVTPEHDIVWEYINPYFADVGGKFRLNSIYRAYRVPYEWVPQAEHTLEKSIEPVNNETFRVAGAWRGAGKITKVDGVNPDARPVTGMSEREDADDEPQSYDFCMVKLKGDDAIFGGSK